MTRIKLPANQSRGKESERGGSLNKRWAVAAPISVLLALSFVETACAPGVERQIVIPIQGAQDFGLNKSELAQYNQTKEDFKNASKDKVFDLTTNNLSSTQSIISSDLTRATGVNITPEQVNIDFDQVDPFWINIGTDRLSFAPVPVDIQVEGEETSRTLLFMFGKAEGGQWGQVGFFSPDQKPNESGEINANLVLDLTENANPEIGGLVIASDGNERFSRQILFTKDKDGKLVLVESFPDPNKPSQAMVLNQNDLFSLADAPNQPQANFTNVSFKMAAPAIATVTPTPPGVGEGGTNPGTNPNTNPEEAPAAVTVKSYETRDASGKLISTEDIYGNVIPVTHEVAAPGADWAGVNERLGTEFTINPDGTIAGIEGLSINMTNGEAIFNFDGKGTEVYHIGNIKVQEINGEKRLLVAGYMWNAETTSWEIFNPGFPMESPEAQTGWFIQADVPNGNWLRWDQRANQDSAIKAGFVKPDGTPDVEAYMKKLFTDENGNPAVRPTTWISVARKSDNYDYTLDGRKDTIHFGALWWLSPKLDEAFAKGESGFLTKEQFPNRTCQSSAFLVDMNAALFSNVMLNGDGSTTSLPSAIDVPLIWERREVTDIFSMLAEGCNMDQETIEAAGGKLRAGLNYTIWPVMTSYPDEEVMMWLNDENGQFLKDPEAIARREAAINGNKLEQSASLDLWGAKIMAVGSLQYWRIE